MKIIIVTKSRDPSKKKFMTHSWVATHGLENADLTYHTIILLECIIITGKTDLMTT